MSITTKANSRWEGDLKGGSGTMRLPSGTYEGPYTFKSRFGEGAGRDTGTNPEELIAAAHAGCFSMALSAELGKAGLTPESIRTEAAVTLEKSGEGFAITAVHLDVSARVPNADQAAFESAANAAKTGCPVSKVLNATITMDARLEA